MFVYSWYQSISGRFDLFTEFALDPKLKDYIRDAQSEYAGVCSSLDLDHLEYHTFKKDYLKKNKLSPDAILQLVIQVVILILS